jgi:Protein of unknown function (DUF2914).
MVVSKLGSFYKNYEYHISSVALLGGFIFDVFTLRRADALFENLSVILYLTIVAVVILLLNKDGWSTANKDSDINFWLLNLLQFSFGALLSAFLILYFRSASLLVSWPFLLMLALAFVANERMKRQYERLTYQVSFFFFALLLFSIFFVPVLVGVIGPAMFVISGVVSLVAIRIFLSILEWVSRDRFFHALSALRQSVLGIFVLMNILYFTNIIPPIPLSLKEAGVYQSVDKEPTGEYVLRKERGGWRDYFNLAPKVRILPDQPVFAYTAIFSPSKFNISVVHEWQYYDSIASNWVSVTKIPLPIAGGRDRGYRTYSVLNAVPGKWRVNVLTLEGQVLGRIGFMVEFVGTQPELVTEIH